MAAIAESLRFLAIVFLAFDLGGFLSPSVSGVLRYASAPQLLFAAGFFFLWLDPGRYASFKPLLTIGKLASIACLFPLALTLARDPKAGALAFGVPMLGAILGFFIAAVDIASLSILLLARLGPTDDRDLPGASRPGQGPEDIERVEGI